jgi:molybdopterin/thiamine biosynthesis adenylyltransferase
VATTREEFYESRDSRTTHSAQTSTFSQARAVLSIDSAAAATLSGQTTFLIATNLIARWCRSLWLVAPSVELHPRSRGLSPGSTYLDEGSLAIARAADPYGDFVLGVRHRTGALHLHIGSKGPDSAFPVAGFGWLALGGPAVCGSAAGSRETALGAVLAACIGAAHLFRSALGQGDLPNEIRLSLWNLRGGALALNGPDVEGGDLGLTYLIGCGAVGSAIAYLIPLAQIQGKFILVDRDTVDYSNLNRSPLFEARDVGSNKAVVTTEYLLRRGLVAEPCVEWFDEAVRAGHVFRARPDLVIPTANDRGVRHSIQAQVPPLQIYGTTGRNWDAFLGRHIPLREDCLACRFPRPPAEGEPPLACSTAPISELPQTQERPLMDAALPFLSTAAGLLAVAELLKSTTIEYPAGPNFACLDFQGDLSDFVLDERRPASSCQCAAQSRIWPTLNGKSRFSSLSTAVSHDSEPESPVSRRAGHPLICAPDRDATCVGDGFNRRPDEELSIRISG